MRRAFTLIELLVVVGIVAVLTGILLATVGSARRQAEATACLSNLRQLGAAFAAYAAEHRGSMPRPSQLGVTLAEDWLRDGAGVVVPGMVGPAVAACPTDTTRTMRSWPHSYAVNETICRILWNGPTLRITQVRRPSEKILLIDESERTIDDGCWAWQQTMGNGRNALANRHDAKGSWGNAAFADGHAERVTLQQSWDSRWYEARR